MAKRILVGFEQFGHDTFHQIYYKTYRIIKTQLKI